MAHFMIRGAGRRLAHLWDTARAGATWRRWRKPTLLALAALLVLSLGGAGWTVLRGVQAKGNLVRAASLVAELERQMLRADVTAARQVLSKLQDEIRAAREATNDPSWRISSHAAVIGPNLRAVRMLIGAIDSVAQSALPSLLEAGASLNVAVIPRNGRIDVRPLELARPRLLSAEANLRLARDQVSNIATAKVLPEVRAGIDRFRRGIDRLIDVTSTASRAAALLPALLGDSGPRTYLVLFQNPAELRATGGMPGAFIVLRADQGLLQIARQGSAAADLQTFDTPVLKLEPEMQELYGDRPGIFPANVNLTPHFPTAAALAREMYRRRSGQTVDGVLALDPVALSYLLRATGPVAMPAGPPLTAERAIPMLLSEAYARSANSAAQDLYFANAAKAVFDVLSSGSVNPALAIASLAQAAGERRLLLWSASQQDRDAIAGTVLEGALPLDDGPRPTVGVFLNDGSGAKLGYYLRASVDITTDHCRRDGRRGLKLRVTLRSTAPPQGLPKYVLGLGLAGDPYTVRTNVMIFSPTGGGVVTANLDGVPTAMGAGVERGRSVAVVTVDVPPGQARTVEAVLLTDVLPADLRMSPELWLTPIVTSWQKSIHSPQVC
jgi:hypothetical protein